MTSHLKHKSAELPGALKLKLNLHHYMQRRIRIVEVMFSVILANQTPLKT